MNKWSDRKEKEVGKGIGKENIGEKWTRNKEQGSGAQGNS